VQEVEEEVLAVVLVLYYDYGGSINKTKQQTVEGGTDGASLHKQWGSAGFWVGSEWRCLPGTARSFGG
jgi:hypothetical protein